MAVSPYISDAEYVGLADKQRELIHYRAELAESGAELAALCFAEKVPPSIQRAIGAILTKGLATKFNSLGDFLRWTSTATDGGSLTLGDPITITWSIVPDGTDLGLSQISSETDNGVSDLIATFNALFGSQSVWEDLLQWVFDQWSRLTGITYVKAADDGAPFPSSSGSLGLRGDVRIGGRSLDGPFGVLAYNYFPNTGDMVIDTSDILFFGSATEEFRALRNTISHEHGHGLGFHHVCPADNTKIMEPFITLQINHSGPDDIAHGNRKYGDPMEKGEGNNSVGTASNLGMQTDGLNFYGIWPDFDVRALSLNSVDDEDFFSVELTNGENVSFHVRPRGSAFSYGDNFADTCVSAAVGTLNSLGVIDLEIELIDTDQSTVLDSGEGMPVGFNENIFDFTAPATGTYYLRVFTNDAPLTSGVDNQVQLYSLRIDSPGRGIPGTPMARWMLLLLAGMVAGLGVRTSWSVVRRV